MKRITLLFILLYSSITIAQVDLQTSSLNVFKNGTYFVVKEGKINAPNSKTNIIVAGSPLLGTYWFTTTKDYKINKVVYQTDTLKRKKTAQSLHELLLANAGKKVKISYLKGKEEVGSYNGILSEFSKNSGLIKVKGPNNSSLYIETNKIIEFIVEESATETFEADSIARTAQITFNKTLSAAPLKLSYVNTGINWIPSYSIKILNDKQLQLELKALVENYAEPIISADLTLTVGAPNFTFGNQKDPLATHGLTGGNLISSDDNSYLFKNNAPVANAMRLEEDAGYSYEEYTSFDSQGEKSNDLYFYQLGKVDLPMNSKSSFSIFSSNINYEDLYEVSLNDYVAYAANRQIFNTNDEKFDVFHALRISNNYSTPLTTAPVFVQDENLNPLAQDQLKYTPVGGKVKIQLAKSPDIVVSNQEEEIEKVERAKKINNNFYSKVTIKGTVKIENLQNKVIQLNSNKNVNGIITKVSDDGKIQKPGKYAGLNSMSSAEWDLKIAAGETKTITYTYDVYVYP